MAALTLTLILLTVVTAALLGLGGLRLAPAPRLRHVAESGCVWLAGIGCFLAFTAVATHGGTAELDLPLGIPGRALHLAVDPLSAPFLLLVLLSGLASAVAATDTPPIADAGRPVRLAGCVLTLLAADGVALAIGIGLVSAGERGNGHPGIAPVLAGIPCLMLGAGLLGPADMVPAFALIRQGTPSLPIASAGVLLMAAGFAAVAGFAPFHRHPRGGAILSTIGVYGLIRVFMDLGGPAPPFWWGFPLLLSAAASVVLSVSAAGRETQLDPALAGGNARLAGVAALGIAVAVMARASDLAPVIVLALGSTWLAVTAQSITGTALSLTGGAILRGAGTQRLDGLGGLIHSMPATSACLAAALYAQAALPAGAGFAAFWMLVQALLEASRSGGILHAAPFVCAALVLGFTAAAATASLLRIIGVVCLGRPRIPRSAAAEEAGPRIRVVLLGLTTLAALVGLLPGPALKLLADPALGALVNGTTGARAGTLLLNLQAGAPGYSAIAIAVLLVIAAFAVRRAVQRMARGGARRVPAWQDGFAPSPPWLPFGDPLTQSAGAGFLPDIKPRSLVQRVAQRIATAKATVKTAVKTAVSGHSVP